MTLTAFQLIVVKPVHPVKAASPMLVTELGISTDFKPLHPSKAHKPMLVTELPIVKDVKPIHP